MSSSPFPPVSISPLHDSSPRPHLSSSNRRETWDPDLLIRPIWEVIEPTHWFSLSSTTNQRVGDLVEFGGRILEDLSKRYRGLRYVLIGSTNNGTARAHLHGFLHAAPEHRAALHRLLRSWKLGRMKDLRVFDPERDAITYVVSQIEEGEILWHDGKTPEPIRFPYRPRVVKATPARAGRERRLFNRNLRAIEDLDRIKRHQRREKVRERGCRARGNGATLLAPPINLVVSIEGLQPLELPLQVPSDALPLWDETVHITWEGLRERIIKGTWSLPTLNCAGEQLGLTQEGVREWLGLRKVAPRLDSSPTLTYPNPLVVDDRRELALVLFPRALELVPPQKEGGGWQLRLRRWSAEVYLRSIGLTDQAEAQDAALTGIGLQISKKGLGLALRSRVPQKGDGRVTTAQAY